MTDRQIVLDLVANSAKFWHKTAGMGGAVATLERALQSNLPPPLTPASVTATVTVVLGLRKGGCHRPGAWANTLGGGCDRGGVKSCSSESWATERSEQVTEWLEQVSVSAPSKCLDVHGVV